MEEFSNRLRAKLIKKGITAKRTKELKSDTKLFYPEGSYGLSKDPLTPNAILIDNATIWTCGPKRDPPRLGYLIRGWESR